MQTAKKLLQMNHIHKRFPGVYALNDVSFDLYAGEVHALLGENGAGKSTLIKILGGIYRKDEGSIAIAGISSNIDSVSDARKNGISIIHQELVLVPQLTVYENIFLGREIHKKTGFSDPQAMIEKCNEALHSFGIDLPVTERVCNLTIAQQQLVEIAKAVSFSARIIVMDEPTSSLTSTDVKKLFATIRTLKEKGIGIIYISHRMSELYEIADRVTVMRDGRYIATKKISETKNDELISLMVGRSLGNFYSRSHTARSKEPILHVENLTTKKVKNISFDLYKGEVLGFGGLVGCGRTETMLALFGIDKKISASIELEGVKLPKRYNPFDLIKKGFALVPENRRDEGLFPVMSVEYNMTLKVLKKFISGISYNKEKEDAIYEDFVKELSIKVAHRDTKISALSGGNQQKVIIASWLAAVPKVLILDEPTRGIDVGAKSEIYQIMNELTDQGVSIIMISSDMPELINMSDRVIVMCDGKITGTLEQNEISQENIMHYAIRY
ncbi:ABC transporter, ATP-binding protein [Treponema socranskii subsp. socranskii VPI DR56BR1116 = ATCC 35536]|uniref:ABC transporter, ATP-binding protein n=2 Tax=Treponema socranskii TaxID=53419 RepID=U1FPF9_TRESO|nr:ABC transporter, ATP-binding protein [Treponema socranskii subsp. socranskii VPI DR56BR1116 = ATCC 35536]ERK05171.1 ABC transporter, ATP-binding protein [Treponema socranskii subsp. socranskii VPI DR56BR1116 = ATCC 35536]